MNYYYKNLDAMHKAHAGTPRQVISDTCLMYNPFSRRVEAVISDLNAKSDRPWLYKIYETFRTDNRQAYLHKAGKSKIAKRGMHGYGCAVDIVPLNPKGQPFWPDDLKYWTPLWEAAEAHGLFPFGKYQKWDFAHIQAVPVKMQSQIVAGNYPWEGEL